MFREALSETVSSLEAKGYALRPAKGNLKAPRTGYYYRASWVRVLAYPEADRGVLELRVWCVGEDLSGALDMAERLGQAFLELWPEGEAKLGPPSDSPPTATLTLRRPK